MQKMWILLSFLTGLNCFSQMGCSHVLGQNLIPNGGFEHFTACPDLSEPHKCVGWFRANMATPDVFSTCQANSMNAGVPINRFGKCYAFQGSGYGGMLSYGEFREYLGIRLREPLKAGQEYAVQMYVYLAPGCTAAIADMGFHFAKRYRLSESSTPLSHIKPQVVNPPDHFLDRRKWTKVGGKFVAEGGEHYVIIGCFTRFPKKRSTNPEIRGYKKPYYYIDNVSTRPVPIRKKVSIKDSIENMSNIYFRLGSASLLSSSCEPLDKLSTYLKTSPKLKLEITGHTDNSGTDSANTVLSMDRAETVKRYLMDKGIAEKRITVDGRGATDPLVENNKAANRQLNRRVSFRVLKD